MYGKNSVKYQSRKVWNNLQQTLDIDLLKENRASTKKLISEYFLNGYRKNNNTNTGIICVIITHLY